MWMTDKSELRQNQRKEPLNMGSWCGVLSLSLHSECGILVVRATLLVVCIDLRAKNNEVRSCGTMRKPNQR